MKNLSDVDKDRIMRWLGKIELHSKLFFQFNISERSNNANEAGDDS